VFLSKITAERVSLSYVFKLIDDYIIQNSPSKIRANNTNWRIKDFSEIKPEDMKAFVSGKLGYRSLLIRSVAFFHPWDLTEGSNVNHQLAMRALIEELLIKYGYSKEKIDPFQVNIFPEAFHNSRRAQYKAIFKDFVISESPRLAVAVHQMQMDRSISIKHRLLIKVEMMQEGFSIKIFSPKIKTDQQQRLNVRMNNPATFSYKTDSKDQVSNFTNNAEGSGLGTLLIKRYLNYMHPGSYFSVKNKGNHALTEITFPRIGQE
jgi:hypothetical protein